MAFDCCCSKTHILQLVDASEIESGDLEISKPRSGNKHPEGTPETLVCAEHCKLAQSPPAWLWALGLMDTCVGGSPPVPGSWAPSASCILREAWSPPRQDKARDECNLERWWRRGERARPAGSSGRSPPQLQRLLRAGRG